MDKKTQYYKIMNSPPIDLYIQQNSNENSKRLFLEHSNLIPPLISKSQGKRIDKVHLNKKEDRLGDLP